VTALLALTRDDVANYVNALFIVYIILIFIRVLLSWIPRMPYYRWLSASVEFVHQVTDPYLSFFRRFLPPIGGGGMGIDVSPIIGVILLFIAQAVVVSLIAG
jgi:YggT family protein